MRVNYIEAGEVLGQLDNVMIVAHKNPDGDAVGSVTALYRVLKKAGKRVCYHLEGVSKNMQYLLDPANEEFDAENLLVVDVGDMSMLNDCIKEKYTDCILNIDHHATNRDFAAKTLIHPECSAACEVLFNLFTQCGYEIDDEIANSLYLGITTDTGCFRYSNTTAETMEVAGKLLRYNVNNGEINRIQFETKSRGLLEFEKMALNSLKTYFDDKCAVITLTDEMFEKSGVEECDIHGVSALPRMLEGVLIGIVIKQRGENHYKISVRSNPPACASDICEALGGGGHKAAAGAEIFGDLDYVTKLLLDVTQKHISDL